MKSQKLTEYNPLACITCRERTLSPDNNYNLEKQKINKLISSTKRFGYFVAIKYDYLVTDYYL